jgi:dihydrofolate synthase/folylpolyglutamate synthase
LTYPEAIQFLYDLRLHGLKLGLENTLRLAEIAGRPQDRLRFIHVAGTNGKGSTCAMLEGIYRRTGLRVGLFTSPHLVSFRERIQVDREWMTEADVVDGVGWIRSLVDRFPTDHQPTFFEVVTVMALRHFADRNCRLVIWETGMGGRLDATNIVSPLASVITNIQLDHERWLGSTRAEIASEKAGIIKPRIPVITATTEADALEVISRTAAEREAPLIVLPEGAEDGPLLPANCRIPLAGAHQRRNAALAAATVAALQSTLSVDVGQLRDGLERVHWPGRMQRLHPRADVEVILDGAHNPAGLAALVEAYREGHGSRRCAVVFGSLLDKDSGTMLGMLAGIASRLVAVPVRSDRSTDPRELVAACEQCHPALPARAAASVADALTTLEKEPLVLVTGSLYLVGEALEAFGVSPALSGPEYALNDWAAPSPAATPGRAA